MTCRIKESLRKRGSRRLEHREALDSHPRGDGEEKRDSKTTTLLGERRVREKRGKERGTEKDHRGRKMKVGFRKKGLRLEEPKSGRNIGAYLSP